MRLETVRSYGIGAIFFVLLLWLGHYTVIDTAEFPDPTLFAVELDSAEQLSSGRRVLVRGLHYGTLSHLFLLGNLNDSEARPRVFAIVALQDPIEIYPDYRIETRHESLTSERALFIDPGSRLSGEPLEPRIITQSDLIALRSNRFVPPEREGAILRADNFDDPLFLAARIIGENRADLRRITRNLAETSAKINRGAGDIARVLGEDEVYHETIEVLRYATVMIELVRDGLEELRETRSSIDALRSLLP